jgi:hypothetical protein
MDDSDLEISPLESICKEYHVDYWKIPEAQHKLFGDHPSARHQYAVNVGIDLLRESCSHILIFDNDMIFMNEFCPPLDNSMWFVPISRGILIYPWLNLFLFSTQEKFLSIDFDMCPVSGEGTDSGGNLAHYLRGRQDDCHTIEVEFKSKVYLVDWQQKYKALCEMYQIQPWYDIFHFLGTSVFHFRGLSNWQKHPRDFLDAKKELILNALNDFQSRYSLDIH